MSLNISNTTHLSDQNFGDPINPEDIITSWPIRASSHHTYYRTWRCMPKSGRKEESVSSIIVDENKYQISLDVQQFNLDEISVKTLGNKIIIEGKHEEKEDQYGIISRHFTRRYILPKGYKLEDIISSLSTDGLLIVMIPRLKDDSKEEERIVPIQCAGPADDIIGQIDELN